MKTPSFTSPHRLRSEDIPGLRCLGPLSEAEGKHSCVDNDQGLPRLGTYMRIYRYANRPWTRVTVGAVIVVLAHNI